MHGSLINEHNMSLGFISVLFCLVAFPGLKNYGIDIRIVEKHSLLLLVSYKYEATTQNTKSIDKRSLTFIQSWLKLKFCTINSSPNLIFNPKMISLQTVMTDFVVFFVFVFFFLECIIKYTLTTSG